MGGGHTQVCCITRLHNAHIFFCMINYFITKFIKEYLAIKKRSPFPISILVLILLTNPNREKITKACLPYLNNALEASIEVLKLFVFIY